MNHLIKNIVVAGIVLLCSCEDHRMDGMEPDKVFLVKRGLVTESAYNIGETVTANYWAYKSGNSATSCTIDFKIDDKLLDAYNLEHGTAYKLLPQNCYQLGEIRFAVEGRELHAPFSFTYDPAAVLAASGGVYESQEFALPIRIVPEGAGISNEEMEGGPPDELVIVFDIKKPVLNILRNDFEALAVTAGEAGTVSYAFEVGMPFTSKWDVSFDFSGDPEVLSDALDLFNAAQSGDYKLLPGTAYEITTQDLAVPVGDDRTEVGLEIDRAEIGLGNFVLPLVLSDVSLPLFPGDRDMIFLPVRSVANRIAPTESWTATASTFNSANPPIDAIDGDPATFWHVVFKGQNGGMKDLDPWVMIDMNEIRTIYQVEIYPRYQGMPGVGVNHIDGYEIFTSETGEDGSWTGHGFHNTSSAADKAKEQFLFDLETPSPARFVKVQITNNQPPNGGNTVGLLDIHLRGS